MNDAPTDQQLLRDYAQSGDERAFRQLADRYSGLIYHTALRVSNNRTLAEDVSQRVLGALAKKSANILRDGVPLAAWLHRSTVLETKSLRRSEARHHRKKEALMLEPTAHSQPERNTPWQDALPELDAAIDTLPEPDRRVLLLHYVDGMSFPEVARRLNKSAAAVQKQSRRALERLQKLLGKRGVTLSIGILATGLTAEMAKAAPLTLMTGLSSVQALNTTTKILAVKKTTVTAIGATILLCGVPLATQHLSIRSLENQMARATGIADQAPPRNQADGPQDRSDFLRNLAIALGSEQKNVQLYLDALDHIESLSNDDLVRLCQDALQGNLQSLEKNNLIRFAIQTLGNRDRELSLNVLLNQLPRSIFNKDGPGYSSQLLISGMRNFSDEAPAAALAWFESNLDSIRQLPEQNGPQDWLESEMRCSLSYGFIHQDPQASLEILRPLSITRLEEHLHDLRGGNSFRLLENPEGYIHVAQSMLPEDRSSEMIAWLASSVMSFRDGQFISYHRQELLLDRDDLTADERSRIATWAGLSSLRADLKHAPAVNMERYRQWLLDQGFQQADQHLGEAMAIEVKNWTQNRANIDSFLTDRKSSGISDQTVISFLEHALSDGSLRFTDTERLDGFVENADDPAAIQEVIDQLKTQDSK